MEELRYWKREYDKHLLGEEYSTIQHYGLKFAGAFPFVSCGGFLPEVSIDGRPLQVLTRGNDRFEHVCLTVSVMNGSAFVVFAWLGSKNGPAEDFVSSFMSIRDEEKANMVLHLVVEHIENTYFRPSWWHGIEAQERILLLKRMRNGTPARYVRTAHTFREPMRIQESLPVVQRIVPDSF